MHIDNINFNFNVINCHFKMKKLLYKISFFLLSFSFLSLFSFSRGQRLSISVQNGKNGQWDAQGSREGRCWVENTYIRHSIASRSKFSDCLRVVDQASVQKPAVSSRRSKFASLFTPSISPIVARKSGKASRVSSPFSIHLNFIIRSLTWVFKQSNCCSNIERVSRRYNFSF